MRKTLVNMVAAPAGSAATAAARAQHLNPESPAPGMASLVRRGGGGRDDGRSGKGAEPGAEKVGDEEREGRRARARARPPAQPPRRYGRNACRGRRCDGSAVRPWPRLGQGAGRAAAAVPARVCGPVLTGREGEPLAHTFGEFLRALLLCRFPELSSLARCRFYPLHPGRIPHVSKFEDLKGSRLQYELMNEQKLSSLHSRVYPQG